jgi:protein gp37
MADRSSIEWTDATWNPVTGCSKISPGCDNCYAQRFSERFRNVQGHYFQTGFDLKLRPEKLGQPFAWKKSRMIFVNSMSDLFHKSVPTEYISRVFDVMERASQHTYQVLTKRSSLLRNFVNARYGSGSAPANIWLGVSIESPELSVRLKHLQETNASVRFVSFEPLLASMGSLSLAGIDWAIVGGESGHNSRPIEARWVREIRDQCRKQDVAFFFKQWGGRTPKAGGNTIDGRQWLDFPTGSRFDSQLLHA